jgi:hypothetical protein
MKGGSVFQKKMIDLPQKWTLRFHLTKRPFNEDSIVVWPKQPKQVFGQLDV